MTNLKDAVERLKVLADAMDLFAQHGGSLISCDDAEKLAPKLRLILSALSGEGEAVAWRWRHESATPGPWVYQESEPDSAPIMRLGVEVQPLYAHPPATWQGMETLPDFDGECFATWQPDYPELWSMHVYREVKDPASGMKPGMRKVFEDQLAEAKGWFPLPSPPEAG